MAYNAAGIYVYCDVPGGDLHPGEPLLAGVPALRSMVFLFEPLPSSMLNGFVMKSSAPYSEAQYLIHILALCGEHDYWHVALSPHRLAYFYSAHLGSITSNNIRSKLPFCIFSRACSRRSPAESVSVSVGFQRKLSPLLSAACRPQEEFSLPYKALLFIC